MSDTIAHIAAFLVPSLAFLLLVVGSEMERRDARKLRAALDDRSYTRMRANGVRNSDSIYAHACRNAANVKGC